MANPTSRLRNNHPASKTVQSYPGSVKQYSVVLFDPDVKISQSMQGSLLSCPEIVYLSTATDIIQLIHLLSLTSPDYVLFEASYSRSFCLSAVKLIHKQFPLTNIIILSASENEKILFETLCAGAYSYILNTQSEENILNQLKQISQGQVMVGEGVYRRMLRALSQLHEKPKFDRYMLTNRESEIMNLMLKGNSYKIIAFELDIAYHTVHNHIKNIYAKLNVNSMTEAITKILTCQSAQLP